jgi:hypothetical protein
MLFFQLAQMAGHEIVSAEIADDTTRIGSTDDIINNGANTPPDVPDPSAIDQTNDLPRRIPRRAGPMMLPRNS